MLHVVKLQQAISNENKKLLEQCLDILDKQINTVIYGLTEKEVKIVEGE